MTVSNTASALRPGVCTSTTRPTTPYTGQTIFETDTNRLLVWNGSSWVIPNQTTTNPNALELIKTDSITSGSYKEITGCFSSTYRNYRVVVTDMWTNGAATNIVFRFGMDATGYYGSQYYDLFTGGANGINRKNNQDSIWTGVSENYSGNSAMSFDVFGPNTTLQHKGIHGTYWGGGYSGFFAGVKSTTTAYTSFSLHTWTGGTFNDCKIYVYGYRNS